MNDAPSFVTGRAARLDEELEALLAELQQLALQVRTLPDYPIGPNSLAYHKGMLRSRIEDVRRLVARVGRARERLVVLHQREDRYRPEKPRYGRPASKRLQHVYEQQQVVRTHMQMDAEALYIFGNMVLDQWAMTASQVLGIAPLGDHAFAAIVKRMEAKAPTPQLATLKERHLSDAVWLKYQVRFYRNTFVEHVDRPWQRGTTMSTYGDDLKFFIVSPSGWVSEGEELALHASIAHLMPQWLVDLPDDHWQRAPRAVLEAIYAAIDQIDNQRDRDLVWSVWRRIGGSTVSYDVWVSRLTGFLRSTLTTLSEEIAARPDQVDFGTFAR